MVVNFTLKRWYQSFQNMLLKTCLLLCFLSAGSAIAQNLISGRVTDEEGVSLPGVNVRVKGSSAGVATDINGRYSISVPQSSGSILVFTFIGMKAQEIAVKDRSGVDVVLQAEASTLKEVLITGFSSQSRETVTTSITKLDTRVLDNIPFTNLGTALQGALAGVQVTTTTGLPGASPRIIIRGGTNIDNPDSSTPLYLIDGVIRDLTDVAQDDIESIQVLKDAAATAIYGARGSNGVVLIKTKSGKVGRTSFTYRYNLTASQNLEKYSFPSAREYLQTARLGILESAEWVATPALKTTRLALLTSAGSWGTGNDLTRNTLWTPQYLSTANNYKLNEGWESMADPIDATKTIIFKDTDFQPLLYQTGLTNNHYFNVSGGSEKASYSAGLGYISAQGVVKTSDYTRTSFNFNGDLKATDRLSFTTRVAYTRSADNRIAPIGDNALLRYSALPNTAKYNFEDGSIAQGFTTTLGNPDYYLPVWNNKGDENKFDRTILSLGSKLSILKGLTFEPLVSLNTYASNVNTFRPTHYNGLTLVTERPAFAAYTTTRQRQADALLKYRGKFGSDHNISAVAGFSYYGLYSYSLSGNGRGAVTDNIQTLNASSTPVSVSSLESNRLLLSYLGSANYDYNQKYLLTLNFRYDGASVLGDENKWGFFPGVSVGWNVHKEKFMDFLPEDLLNFKLRVSYGVNGNISGLGDFTPQGAYAPNQIYGGASAIQNTIVPNQELQWERSKTLNFGADIGLFKNRLNILVDVYRRVTDNLLTQLTLPPSTGFSSIFTNFGSLEGKGVEVELSGSVFAPGSAFQWQPSFNISHTMNKVLKLPFNNVENNRVGGELLWDSKSQTYVYFGGKQEGARTGEVFAYKQLGVYATDAEAAAGVPDMVSTLARRGGDAIWQDTDGNGRIDARDRIRIGNSRPDWSGGFFNYFTYKNLNLVVRTDYALGHVVYNQLGVTFDQNGAGDIQMSKRMVDRGWKQQGDVTDVPRYIWLDPKNNIGRGSTAYFSKGDYLALREITLGYSIPSKLMQRIKLKALRLNFTANNVYYFTRVKEIDAINTENGGNDNGRYPLSRNFIFGANLSL